MKYQFENEREINTNIAEMSSNKRMQGQRCAKAKESRWDRIRKRHMSTASKAMKNETVKRLIAMDFIGKHHDKLLRGERDAQTELSPLIVMELRHKTIKTTNCRTSANATRPSSASLHTCRAHNIAVEEHYINNELTKLRHQLAKHHERNRKVHKKAEASLQLNNEALVRSLASTSTHLEDFYAAPIEALAEMQNLCSFKSTEITVREETVSLRCDIASVEHQQDTERSALGEQPLADDDQCQMPNESGGQCLVRCVRFDHDIEVRSYKRELSSCSNTSGGIDSVISDLAEEALMELKLEEEAAITSAKETSRHNPAVQSDTQVKDSTPQDLTPAAGDGNMENLLIIQSLDLPNFDKNHPTDPPPNAASEDDDETESNQEQNAIIEQLFQSRAHTNTEVLQKCFLKWIHYTTIQKIERENCTSKSDRVHKINVFLDKIRREKFRVCRKAQVNATAGDVAGVGEDPRKQQLHTGPGENTKKYKNKIKVQQDIIDLQRLKLERQERLIMELKLCKMSDEAKEARQQLKDELKTVIRCGDPKAKAKAKCIQLIGNLREVDDNELTRLQGKGLLMPKFLQNMQERALERSVRHEQARQRRLQQDAEREAQKIAIEEAKRLEDEEAKRMRIEALKEKRRLEKFAKVLKERERQHAVENNRKSQEFCRLLLLRRVGMEAFKRLLQRKLENIRKCQAFRRDKIARAYFCAWRDYYLLQYETKKQRADCLYQRSLLRCTMVAWKAHIVQARSKFLVAVDWYDLKLIERTFVRWFGFTKHQKIIEDAKMQQATSHHEWHLKWKVLDCWQRLSQILQLERETEERRQRWRMKIWDLLPDYTPNREDRI